MKLRKLFAALTASAIAITASAVVAAAEESVVFSGKLAVQSTGNWWDEGKPTQAEFIGETDPATITKVVVTADKAGAIGYNCTTTGDYVKVDLADGASAELTDVIFGESYHMTLCVSSNDTSYVSNFTWDVYADPSLAAAEEEATEEETVEEEATEEEAVEEEATEEEVVEEEVADEEAAAEPDWSAYDKDAMVAANEAFTLGGSIDIYAVVGDAWADIAKIEADFIWTPGLGGWCGGAGIGNGAVAADGSAWIAGAEYGAANANAACEPDGKATQTIVDLSANPLVAIASVNDDGTTSFGHIQIQNWWNGVEANAQVAAIRFLDADGNVLGSLEYAVDAPEAEEEAATGDVDASTDSSKGSPDTGVADVAAVAGIAVVAAGAFIVAKKRK